MKTVEEYHELAAKQLANSFTAGKTDESRSRFIARAAVYAELAKTAHAIAEVPLMRPPMFDDPGPSNILPCSIDRPL